MTRDEYIKQLLSIYSLINVMSNNNESKVLRMRNKSSDRDMVLRSYPNDYVAYEELYHIQSDNLPLIYDVIRLDDGQIILEEYIDGITVAQVMETGHYHYAGAKKVITAVCNALHILHKRNLVHRDVKPENIIIDNSGRIVLIDLNASRKISSATRDTIIMGTVGYASPEQLGLSQSDSRTDIYAVGVLLNVMMTGKHPSEELARGKVGRIVRKCTNLNQNERYQTVETLMKAL